MGSLENIVGAISSFLFIIGTAINIFVTMRISKIDNSLREYIRNECDKAEANVKAEVRREIDRMEKKIEKIEDMI